MSDTHQKFNTFSEFYPYYLTEHRNRTSRRLHFAGTLLVIILAIYILLSAAYHAVLLLPVAGYGFAWTGHFFFEKNKPATFSRPFYSLLGDFRMFWDILTGKIKF